MGQTRTEQETDRVETASAPPAKKFVGRSPEDNAARRRRIVEVGRRLAIEGGPDAVQMRTVAAEVGVTLVTLYRIVPSKQALLLLIAADSVDRMWHYYEKNPIVGGTRSERAARALKLAFGHVAKTPKLGHAMAMVIFGAAETERAVLETMPDQHHPLVEIMRRAVESDGVPLDERGEDVLMLWRVVWGGALSMWLSGLITYEKAQQMIDLACNEVSLG